MPINWDMLKVQTPPGGAVATIAPQQSSADSLASGIMSGAQAGQSIMSSRAQMQAQQQAMDQNAQLFPSQLTTSQEAAKQAVMKTGAMEGELEAGKQKAAAFNQSWDQGMNVMKKMDPAGYLDLQNKISTNKNNLAQAAEHMSNAQIKAPDAYAGLAMTGAQLVNAAHSAQMQTGDPQQAQKVYQTGLSILNQSSPELAQLFPKEYDQKTYLAFTKLGADAQNDMMSKKAKSDPTGNQKEAADIAKFTELEKSGQIDPQSQTYLNTLRQAQKNNRQTVDPLDSELGKVNAKIYGDSMTKYTDIQGIRNGLTEAREKLKKVPAYAMNPAMGWSGAQKLNPEFQQYNQTVQNTALSVKDSLYKLGGGQGFSNKDAERLEDIARGGIGAYKGTAEEAIGFLDRMLTASQAAEYLKSEKIMKNSANYEQWKQSNPEPQVQVKVGNKSYKVPASQLQNIIKEQKAVIE